MKAGTIRLQIMPNRTGQPEPGSSSTGAQKYFSSAAAESACRQYRVVREVLLPEAELLLRQQGGVDCKSCRTGQPDCKSGRTKAELQIWLDRGTAATGEGVEVDLTENNEKGDDSHFEPSPSLSLFRRVGKPGGKYAKACRT